MSKLIKYNLQTRVNHGTMKTPVWAEILTPVEMDWTETNEELAKLEAHNGEYSIVDSGQTEATTPTTADRVTALEEALDLLLSGVTE